MFSIATDVVCAGGYRIIRACSVYRKTKELDFFFIRMDTVGSVSSLLRVAFERE